MSSYFQRFIFALACVVSLFSAGALRAEDKPAPADDAGRPALHLLPQDSVLLLHIDGPRRLVNNPLIKDMVRLLRESVFHDEIQRRLENPQIQQLKQFLEFTLSRPWDQALDAMTAQGVTVGLGRQDAGFTPMTAVLSCDNEKTTRELKDAIFGVVFNNAGGPKKMAQADYRGITAFQLDEGHMAFTGTRVVVTNRRSLLEAALDRLLDPAKRTDFKIAPQLDWSHPVTGAATTGRRPVFTTWINLEAAREDEKFRKGLSLPTDNIQALLLVGGYVDLLRRARFASAALFADDGQLELSLRTDVGREGMVGSLAGFFAPPAGEAPPPRLKIDGEVLSLAWTRDYSSIWETRDQLLVPESIKKLEADSEKAVLAGNPGALELFNGLGREWNLVVTLPVENGYKHPASPQYPAFGLMLSLKDETLFREKILGPLNKFLDNIAFGSFMKLTSETHAGVELRHASFLVGNTEPAQGQTTDDFTRALRSFDPALGVYRGRFLFASNLALAKKMIDARDATTAGEQSPNSGDDQLSLAPLSEILGYYKADLLRQAVLKSGMTVQEVEREFERFQTLLKQLKSFRRESRLTGNAYEIRHILGESRTP